MEGADTWICLGKSVTKTGEGRTSEFSQYVINGSSLKVTLIQRKARSFKISDFFQPRSRLTLKSTPKTSKTSSFKKNRHNFQIISWRAIAFTTCCHTDFLIITKLSTKNKTVYQIYIFTPDNNCFFVISNTFRPNQIKISIFKAIKICPRNSNFGFIHVLILQWNFSKQYHNYNRFDVSGLWNVWKEFL